MNLCDWSSDVCSSDLSHSGRQRKRAAEALPRSARRNPPLHPPRRKFCTTDFALSPRNGHRIERLPVKDQPIEKRSRRIGPLSFPGRAEVSEHLLIFGMQNDEHDESEHGCRAAGRGDLSCQRRVPRGFIQRTQRRARSEERRVGKECRSRWSPYH